MRHQDALEKAKQNAAQEHNAYYVFQDETGEYFFGDEEDAVEQFFPEEIVEIVDPEGGVHDLTDLVEDWQEWH